MTKRVASMIPILAVAFLGSTRDVVGVENVDLDAIHRIKEEGFSRSKVMDIASYLTDVHGPRLTGSPQLRAAAEYAVKALTEMGLSNAHLESWGPFGRGWSQEHFEAHVVSPQKYTLVGYPRAWTPGTNGKVTGEAVMVTLARDEDLQTWKGKLKGKFVLLTPPRDAAAPFTAAAKRLTDTDLADLAKESEPGRGPTRAMGGGQPQQAGQQQQPTPLYVSPPDPAGGAPERPGNERAFATRRMKYLIDEGVLAVLEPGRGDAGLFIVSSGGPRDAKEPPVLPQVVLAIEHYGRLARTLSRKVPVTIEMDVRNRFWDKDVNSFNVIAEIPGTDKRDEVVMLGAHLDSWHSGTGATDNAAGSAAAMEAVRILKASGVKLRRTVRVGLWTGEEQGLLGSRAYVKAHFADRQTMKVRPEHARFSSYFNLDNGTGAIRGIYAQSNDAAVPLFEQWVAPLRNMGVTTVSPRNTGGTDHLSFDSVGLPGFQFIQDPMDYDSRTHHTNVDTYERLQPADMMKNAVVMAIFAYDAANRPDKLPRKPLPKPAERPRQNATPQARPADAPPAPAAGGI
jgi:carboxypeptidase Q